MFLSVKDQYIIFQNNNTKIFSILCFNTLIKIIPLYIYHILRFRINCVSTYAGKLRPPPPKNCRNTSRLLSIWIFYIIPFQSIKDTKGFMVDNKAINLKLKGQLNFLEKLYFFLSKQQTSPKLE